MIEQQQTGSNIKQFIIGVKLQWQQKLAQFH